MTQKHGKPGRWIHCRCEVCVVARRLYNRVWRKKHRLEIRTYSKAWRSKHPRKWKASQKKYRDTLKVEIRTSNKAYYQLRIKPEGRKVLHKQRTPLP